VLKRVWSSFPYGEILLIGHTDIISNDDVSLNLHAYLDHTHYDQNIPSYHWESCTLRYRNRWQGKSSCSLKWVNQSWQIFSPVSSSRVSQMQSCTGIMNTVWICGEESSTSQARASEEYVIVLPNSL
jgi:hypothetical protein